MTDDRDMAEAPGTFGDLPIQPTGSGVQDLEIAYEQMRLAEGEAANSVDPVPTEDGVDVAESAAHPS
ncbi:hypothetical protein [Sphingomonas sp.]|uniref:hypothetical protein n=1 Tax=Sphingomonas sp. TaxID=28214 RepID=UPI0031DAE0D0